MLGLEVAPPTTDVWRDDVLALLDAFSEPVAVLLVLVAFVLGLGTVRFVTGS